MKIKLKLKDLTLEQYEMYECGYNCENCIFKDVVCNSGPKECWICNKESYSEEFLNQEIEINCEILTKKEKEYLKFVLKPYRENIIYLKKLKTSLDEGDKEYIAVFFKDVHTMYFPRFEKGKMYKGMELYTSYTPKDLELWENKNE